MSGVDAAAARIGAALQALEQEIAAAGIPLAFREAFIITLVARRRDEWFWRDRVAHLSAAATGDGDGRCKRAAAVAAGAVEISWRAGVAQRRARRVLARRDHRSGPGDWEVDPPGTGIDSGVWHAVERIHPPRMTGDPDRGVAVCGRAVTVAAKFGPFDRERFPDRTCHKCTWAVAARAGTVGQEIARLAVEDPEPVLAARVAAAIVAAQSEPGADDEPDHPRTVALLAAVSAHAPTPLISPECGQGGCAHPPRVPCPTVAVACLAYSQRCGGWAGDGEGLCMPECTITAPCAVMRALAAHYRITRTDTGQDPDHPTPPGDRS